MSDNKIRETIVPTDESGVGVLTRKGTGFVRNKLCTFFVSRTIVYPVVVYYNGVPSEEIRAYVRAQEYCTERKWEEALEIEKKFPKTNKTYVERLKAADKKVVHKEAANPFKLTILEMK